MPWLSLSATRFAASSRGPETALSLRNPIEVASGMRGCFAKGELDDVQRWREEGHEARSLVRDLVSAPDGDHHFGLLAALATFVVADMIAGGSSELLEVQDRFKATDALSLRALQLLRHEDKPESSKRRTSYGHIYAPRALDRALASAPIERLSKLVTTADHPLFHSHLARWVPIVGLSLALRTDEPERVGLLRRFMATWNDGPPRTIVFERQRRAPAPIDPDDENRLSSTTHVAFANAEFRGFDAVEVGEQGAICYHYIDASWQTGDVSWADPADAYWFLSCDELQSSWNEVKETLSQNTWKDLEEVRARGVRHYVMCDRKKAPEYRKGRADAEQRHGVRISAVDLMEL